MHDIHNAFTIHAFNMHVCMSLDECIYTSNLFTCILSILIHVIDMQRIPVGIEYACRLQTCRLQSCLHLHACARAYAIDARHWMVPFNLSDVFGHQLGDGVDVRRSKSGSIHMQMHVFCMCAVTPRDVHGMHAFTHPYMTTEIGMSHACRC